MIPSGAVQSTSPPASAADERPNVAATEIAGSFGRHASGALAAAPAPHPPIFIGGAGRSGTTLLRVILDTHSRIACGPEMKVIPMVANMWAQFQTTFAPILAESQVGVDQIDALFRDFILKLLEPHRISAGKARIAEKTPNNVFFFAHLHRLFPNATFLHMLRDGRDVVASLLTMDWKTDDGTPIPYTRDARLAARYWSTSVVVGRTFAQQTAGRSRYHEIRYEDLIDAPEACLRPLFEFLGEAWEPGVLAYHERPRALGNESSAEQVSRPLDRASAGRWRTDLSNADRIAVKEEIGGLLIALGYARDMSW